MTDTSALENLKYAHACDVALDLSSQEVHELWAEIEARDKRIAELEAAQRWRVVADGESPETYKPVLTVDMSEATQIPVPAFYNPDTKCWSTHFKYDLWVTHWMPLPESPNDTQIDALVYGKDSKPLPCPFCGSKALTKGRVKHD